MQYSGTCDLVCAKIMCRLLGLFHTDDHKHIPAWCVSKRKDPKYAGLWLCGSVAPSDHRSLHLPASRGGFQEMPQVVAVREIPPDYNHRLYKDAAQCLDTAHWSTSVLSVKKKCRSVPLRLHLFILLVTIPVRCGPGPCEWSLWSDVVHDWQKQAMWSSNTTAQSSMHLMFYLNTV